MAYMLVCGMTMSLCSPYVRPLVIGQTGTTSGNPQGNKRERESIE
jgi:hypothetical protein